MGHKRTRLAQQRKAAGLSQERLAEILGVDRSTIGRWEAGDTDPQPWLRPRVAAALDLSTDELRAVLDGTPAPPEDPQVHDSLPGSTSSRLGAPEAHVLLDARRHYERMYRNSGGLPAKVQLERFLSEHAAPLLAGSIRDSRNRDALRAMGSLVALAGICSYDCEQYGAAQWYFRRALQFADDAEDLPFGAYIDALMVNQALALRDFRQAADHVEEAIGYAGRQISPALEADLRAMQANAYAAMGERQLTYVSITHSESAAQRIRTSEEPPETGYVQPGLIEAKLGEALISLGDLRPAFAYARKALESEDHPRGRVNRLASMATLELKSNEIEHAAAISIEMAQCAEGMESRRLHSRFRELRIGLSNSRAAAASDAVARLDRSLNLFAW
ncbi:helix-turn-helix transcriptional regulator [Kribbella sp. NPDC005582]|uniref:helix-turn-helix transcriptional regulator n=1 Tax=Kribbella sp. NPDC005582 TaxID=3156893 RepID=UPI0033AE311B